MVAYEQMLDSSRAADRNRQGEWFSKATAIRAGPGVPAVGGFADGVALWAAWTAPQETDVA
jgi:hypothetical protein